MHLYLSYLLMMIFFLKLIWCLKLVTNSLNLYLHSFSNRFINQSRTNIHMYCRSPLGYWTIVSIILFLKVKIFCNVTEVNAWGKWNILNILHTLEALYLCQQMLKANVVSKFYAEPLIPARQGAAASALFPSPSPDKSWFQGNPCPPQRGWSNLPLPWPSQVGMLPAVGLRCPAPHGPVVASCLPSQLSWEKEGT